MSGVEEVGRGHSGAGVGAVMIRASSSSPSPSSPNSGSGYSSSGDGSSSSNNSRSSTRQRDTSTASRDDEGRRPGRMEANRRWYSGAASNRYRGAKKNGRHSGNNNGSNYMTKGEFILACCSLIVLFSIGQVRFAFSDCGQAGLLFSPAATTMLLQQEQQQQARGLTATGRTAMSGAGASGGSSRNASSTTLRSYRESYGFFDDILDGAWEQMRRKAHDFVQYKDPIHPESGYDDPIMWYLRNLQPVFTCPHVTRVGGHDDGPKWTCDPQRLLKRPDCLVYSVGSEGKYEFEDALADTLSNHCEIHIFDPSDYERPGDVVNRNIHYHRWGLRSSYDGTYNPHISKVSQKRAVDGEFILLTFQETLERLGHVNRTIDIFKIDCEKCEWANYKDWIKEDIRQILIETHGVPSPVGSNKWHHGPMYVSDFFDAFTENHFAMFSKEVNVYGGGNCVEFSFLKLHPDFWRDPERNLTNAALPVPRSRRPGYETALPLASTKIGTTTSTATAKRKAKAKKGGAAAADSAKRADFGLSSTVDKEERAAQIRRRRDRLKWSEDEDVGRTASRQDHHLRTRHTRKATHLTWNPVPENMRNIPDHPERKIPHRLIFTYKTNIMESKSPRHLYDNVRQTISRYRAAWDEPDAPYWFLDDTECEAAIRMARPELGFHFQQERKGAFKADICRIAALYLTGGYYFDVDMRTMEPALLENNVTFSSVYTAYDRSRKTFFQSFLASEPRSKLLDKTFDVMSRHYALRKKSKLMGPETLREAYETTAPEDRGEVKILKEIDLGSNMSSYPDVARQNGLGTGCNFAVHDPDRHVLHFFSRIVGAGQMCLDPDSIAGREYLNEHQAEVEKKKKRVDNLVKELLREHNNDPALAQVLSEFH